MSYFTLNAVPRTPFADELLVISTIVAHPSQPNVSGCLMARARLEGGPIRFQMASAPTATVGSYLQNGDIWELSRPELDALITPGGMILDLGASADAKLWFQFYR